MEWPLLVTNTESVTAARIQPGIASTGKGSAARRSGLARKAHQKPAAMCEVMCDSVVLLSGTKRFEIEFALECSGLHVTVGRVKWHGFQKCESSRDKVSAHPRSSPLKESMPA
jgi:hypothetical protein